ncbi:MAG: VWA domain-containing protein [Anaerolineae bacterium]|nr:VWA domain-containing protein [Anaerolineae bacterium]
MATQDKDLYDILDISPIATEADIKRAYRALARRYHPDSGGETASAQHFQEVQAAYDLLSDPAQRRAYDRQRQERLTTQGAAFSWEVLSSQHQMRAIPEEQALYLLINIKPAENADGQRLPINLALVIDRSTSMQGKRLDYVKAAAHQIVDELQDFDSLSVVTFSDRADVVVTSQKLTNRPRIQARISGIWAAGGTEIFQGLSNGLEQIRRFHSPNTMSHLLLLTDGQTYGDEDKCISASQQAGTEHITISTLGIGEDWNHTLMEEIARQAGGSCFYIAHPKQLRHILEQYVQGLYGVVARDFQLTIRLPEGVHLADTFRCFPSIDRMLFESGEINLSQLRSDSRIQIMMELTVASQPEGQHRLAQLELSGVLPATGKRERLIYDHEAEFVARPEPASVPTPIINAMNRVNLFRMQEQAWEALESGAHSEASQRLEAVATRLLDMGERDLANVALLEASRASQGMRTSTKAQKTIRFGTRYLGTK